LRWLAVFRNLNSSLLGVWRAELAALVEDLAASGRRLRGALVLLALASALLVLLIGTLVFAAIAGLAVVMPLWGAALVVAGVLALAGGIVAGVGVSKLRSVENPADTVRRRVDDHLVWWNSRLERSQTPRRRPTTVDDYED